MTYGPTGATAACGTVDGIEPVRELGKPKPLSPPLAGRRAHTNIIDPDSVAHIHTPTRAGLGSARVRKAETSRSVERTDSKYENWGGTRPFLRDERIAIARNIELRRVGLHGDEGQGAHQGRHHNGIYKYTGTRTHHGTPARRHFDRTRPPHPPA